MDFIYDLTIPANTSASAPVEHKVDVGVGIIHLVEIEQAPGCKGMVYAAVRQGLHQVWPTNPGGAFRSNGRVYSSREHYLMALGDSELVIKGWSPGTTYQHIVQFRFCVLDVDIEEPWRRQEGLLEKIKRALGVS